MLRSPSSMGELAAMYSSIERPSVPPERLLKATPLMGDVFGAQ
jgi:hypothetical protein